MSDFAAKRDEYLREAKVHCRRAERFAALNVGGVVLTAALAALAAVTSLTDVPTWLTTASAGLSAALGILTASFKAQDKSAEHTRLAADLKRLSSEYGMLADWKGPLPAGDYLLKLTAIETSLNANTPVPEEERWVAAWPPAASAVSPA